MDESLLNILWVLTSAALVFLMQGGFLCLEAGLTRTKNSINVAFKNIADFGISATVFWAISFSLMFGNSVGGWFGFDAAHLFYTPSGDQAGQDAAFFIFQLMFASTGATIISGATAERLHFTAYVFVTIIFTGIIYPFVGHWAWSTNVIGDPSGWLNKNGFIDFAGSTVVHSTGGWVALALLLILGPRTGKYDEKGAPREIPPANMPMAMLGTIILVFGWVGFNGGSVLAFDNTVPPVIVNTMVGGVGGLNAAMFALWLAAKVGWIRQAGRIPNVGLIMNGLLAGLVAVTANCHIITTPSAFIIGAIGGIISVATAFLLDRFKIDDAVGAIPVHLTPGIWGTLAVAFFADAGLLGSEVNRAAMAQTQLTGIFVTAVWSFVIAFVFLWTINKIHPFRVSAEEERVGLNVSEHGARTEMLILMEAMVEHERTGDLSVPVPEEPFTEIGQIAHQYNRVRESLRSAMGRIQAVFRDLNDGIVTFNEQGGLLSLNPAAEKLLALPAAGAAGIPVWDAIMASHRPHIEARQLEDAEPFDLFRTGNVQEIHYMEGNRTAQAIEWVASKGRVDNETVFTGLLRNITQRIETESSRQRLMKKLTKARNLQLVGMLGRHSLPEVKTLQAIILGSAETMRSSPGPHADEASTVATSAEKAIRLIESLERVAQARNENLPLLDAAQAVRSALDSKTALALFDQPASSLFRISLHGEGFAFRADLSHIEEILLPLAHNALKASPVGTQPELSLRPVHLDTPKEGMEPIMPGDYLALTISDRGPGISTSLMDRLGEPYVSASVGKFRRGEGLGIATASGMAKFLAGGIEISQHPEGGTTMTVFLPLHRTPVQMAVSTATSNLAGTGSILVLDDDRSQSALAKSLLESAGYRVTTTHSVAEAIRALGQSRFDLALIDLVVTDGLEPLNGHRALLSHLRPELPVIVIAGNVPDETVGQALRDGARAFLRKPFDFGSLARAVKKELF